MGIEIERKFLVRGTEWKQVGKGKAYRQGYLSRHPDRTVRVRIAGNQGYVTIKGRATGASRPEYEYPVPVADAEAMLEHLCEKPLIEKVRYEIAYEGLVWEVDEFGGENRGLVVAEVELKAEDQAIVLPDWVGREVTGEEKYYNAYLSTHPFCQWNS